MLLIIFGRIIQFLLMLITLRVSTYLLLPAEIGKIALISSNVAFISLFLINPVGMYVNRYLHHWNNKGQIKKRIKYYWFYIAGIALSSAIILGLMSSFRFINPYFSTVFLMSFIACTLFFNTLNQVVIPSLNMLGFRLAFTVLSLFTVFSSVLFAVILVIFFGRKAEFWLGGLLLGQVLFALIGSNIFYKKVNNSSQINQEIDTLNDVETIFNYCWPLALAVGFTWFQSLSYRFFIESSFGLPTLGLFVAGYGISSGIITAFEAVFTTYFQPIFYKKISNEDQIGEAEAWNDYAAAIVPSLILLFFVISALAPHLTYLLLAKNYQNSAKFLVWGAFIEMFRVLMNVFSMAAHAKKNTLMLIIPNLIGAVAAVSSMYILIPSRGLEGIGLGLAIAGSLACLVLYLSIKRKLLISLPYSSIKIALFFGLFIWIINYYLILKTYYHQLAMSIFCLLFTGMIALCAEFFLLKRLSGFSRIWGQV